MVSNKWRVCVHINKLESVAATVAKKMNLSYEYNRSDKNARILIIYFKYICGQEETLYIQN